MAIAVRKTVWQSLDEFEDSFGVSWGSWNTKDWRAVLKQVLSSLFMISSILEQVSAISRKFSQHSPLRKACWVNFVNLGNTLKGCKSMPIRPFRFNPSRLPKFLQE